MSSTKHPRRRKAPKNCEWRGDTLWGRVRIKGRLKRFTLRTGDVEVARRRVREDIERLKAQAFFGDQRVRYQDVVAAWAERHVVHAVGPRTARRYAVSLRQLEPWLLALHLDEIDKAKVREIVDARRASGVSTATIRRDLTALSSVLAFAEVDDNVALAALKRLKERRDPIVLPEPAHVARLAARCPGRLGALVQVARLTGCRLDELASAERSGLDHARRQLTVRGKGNRPRVIDLDYGGAYEILRALPVALHCRWLFWHGSGQPYRNLSSRIAALVRAEARACAKAGIEFRPFRFHDLRHLHAVEYLKDGGSIYDLQQRLGHASIKTTELYLKFLTPEEARQARAGRAAAAALEQRGA